MKSRYRVILPHILGIAAMATIIPLCSAEPPAPPGSYLILVEEDFRGKNLLYRCRPAP